MSYKCYNCFFVPADSSERIRFVEFDDEEAIKKYIRAVVPRSKDFMPDVHRIRIWEDRTSNSWKDTHHGEGIMCASSNIIPPPYHPLVNSRATKLCEKRGERLGGYSSRGVIVPEKPLVVYGDAIIYKFYYGPRHYITNLVDVDYGFSGKDGLQTLTMDMFDDERGADEKKPKKKKELEMEKDIRKKRRKH